MAKRRSWKQSYIAKHGMLQYVLHQKNAARASVIARMRKAARRG